MEPILLDDLFDIPETPEGPGDDGNGVFTFIYRGKKLQDIARSYGREHCCLKIFKNKEAFQEDYHKQWWGHSQKAKGTLMAEAIFIQNIYALEGLAPRIYAILPVIINGEKHWAHLTDDLGHWETCEQLQHELITGPIQEIADIYGFEVYNDGREYNVVGEKYVDFQAFHLKPDYAERMKKRLIGVANVGKWGPWMNYHDIPEFGITGGRKNEQRIEQMKLNELDFRGCTVLDVGCSEGFFCRYAMNRGASRVVGIDLPGVIKPAAELAYWLEYNNIDFYGYDLLHENPKNLGKFNIMFYFSMCQHIGMPEWVNEMTKDILVFEGNGKGEDAPAMHKINDWFDVVVDKGKTNDLMERPILWCIR